ncbi:hypothetical protein F0145_20160 [Adhaeribacter rhizoryzae]|uniref:SdiA-regulated family protein n=2 Tax=Adhaeribacter rhizoryzae TaxID=2607907 RepID=A0A5M6D915_9BACT|nr:hypothetical protein F0145_20160 [Adhaeribacter rhizoryzae]
MSGIRSICANMLLAFFLLSCDGNKAADAGKKSPAQEAKKKKKDDWNKEAPSTDIAIRQKWEVPAILKEVSGIAFLGNNQFACVQDEAGVIFILNTSTGKIDKQVTFGAAADYEGIAMVGRTAYVVRSEGKIFEVDNIDRKPPRIREYSTGLTKKNNVEGIAYDQKQNRLLLVIKGAEAGTKDYKGIYAFNLQTKKFVAEPVFKINLHDSLLANYKGENLNKALRPAEIAIDPVTGLIYLIEASNPQLFILNNDGSLKLRYKLDETVFGQPEGLTFSPSGDLYISNEGKKEKGNILKVQLR